MTDMATEFECAIYSSERYPDDLSQWPESHRRASEAAIDKLLEKYPQAKIVDDSVYCWADGQRPPDVPAWINFVMIRRIRLDQPVPV